MWVAKVVYDYGYESRQLFPDGQREVAERFCETITGSRAGESNDSPMKVYKGVGVTAYLFREV